LHSPFNSPAVIVSALLEETAQQEIMFERIHIIPERGSRGFRLDGPRSLVTSAMSAGVSLRMASPFWTFSACFGAK